MTGAARRALAALAIPAGLLLSCRHDDRPGAEPARTAAAPADARTSLVAWLECEECTDEQLAAVVALGPEVVPTLAATLREGLSPASRARLELQLRERHAARVAGAGRHPASEPVLGLERYVAHHVRTRDALHRSRAAVALGRIRTPEARQALREALDQDPPPSVEQSIRDALGR